MRVLRVALLAAVLLAASATSAAATPKPHAISTLRLSVSGEIEKLDQATIAIGRLARAIPPKLALSAGPFVIGDPVATSCLDGKLDAIKYAPELATAQSNGPPSPAAAISSTPKPSGGITSFSVTFGQIVFSTGVVTTSTTGPLTTTSGTVEALDSSSITVNGSPARPRRCSRPSLRCRRSRSAGRPR